MLVTLQPHLSLVILLCQQVKSHVGLLKVSLPANIAATVNDGCARKQKRHYKSKVSHTENHCCITAALVPQPYSLKIYVFLGLRILVSIY